WATVPGGSGPYRDPQFVHNGAREKPGKFKTDAVGDYAIDFLDQQKSGHPFYLLVPFFAPHTPFDYQPEDYRRWSDDSAFHCFPDAPMSPWQNPGLRQMFGKREPKHAYSALISGVDATSAASSRASTNCACATTRSSSSPPTRAGTPATTACGARA